MSILHRLSGVALLVGLIEGVIGLYCLSHGPTCYQGFLNHLDLWYGRLINFCLILGLSYHFFNGLRHLAWDAGFGFSVNVANKSGYIVLTLTVISSLALTVLWFY